MGGRMTSEATPSKEDKDLMLLKSKFNDDEPWYADFVNYIVGKVVSPNWNFKKRKSGHHGAKVTARKVYQSGFYWPGVFKDANEYSLMLGIRFRAISRRLRFGVSKALISDRGTHFCNSQLEKALQKYGVTHKLFTAYHPQTNWQTKVTNKAIKRILERSVGYNPKDWSERLNDALWAFRMAYKTPTRKSRLLQLNELAELRVGAYENTRIYKEQTKKWHDSRLRGEKYFKEGDKVLLYNSHLKMYPGKLKSKWSGSNIVKTVYPYRAVEIIDEKGFSFKVNRKRLKKYYEGNIDKEDHEVIEFKNGPCCNEIDLLVTDPSRKIRRIRAYTHQRPQRKQVQYAAESGIALHIVMRIGGTNRITNNVLLASIELVVPRHFKTLSLDELRLPDFNLFFDQEYSEEEVAKTMAETMEQYMSKTRADYKSGVARPKIKDKDNFELKVQFLKEL
ncbi:reverse transcriptase domain-containing protein [Tanacetum coccineum]|uniref:Reverse transcriptase domain-containing protein n=1 Tax=Tanacetum coccineum TaxID=301880 RepID=A0ABQ5JB65_9ASTR